MFLLLIHVLSLFFAQGQNTLAACNTQVMVQCINNSSEPWMQDLMQGKLSVIETLDIDYVCSVLNDIYFCIGDNLNGCNYGFKYVLQTVVSSTRYICNEGKPGFTKNAQCFTNPTVLSKAEGCTTTLFQNFPNIYEISLDTQRDQLCGLFGTWSKCMSESVRLMCDQPSLMYMYSLIEATLKPSRYMLLCNIGTKSCLSSPCLNGGVCLSTFGLDYACQCTGDYTGRHCENKGNYTETTTTSQSTSEQTTTVQTTTESLKCNLQGAMRCLVSVAPDVGNFFTMIKHASSESHKQFCWTLDNVYTCIGRKLDHCSREVRLMRDFVVSAGRYICNTESAVLANNIDCIEMLSNINLTIHCMDDFREDLSKFFIGQKSVFDYTPEFCSLSSNWTECYMKTVERRCTPESYIYMYNYLKYSGIPVKKALQCDILSGVQVMKPSPEPTSHAATPDLVYPEPTHVVVPDKTFHVPTNHCESSPCYFGATCISQNDDFRCICPRNLFGRRCGVGIGGCPGFPCYNGGSCYTDDSGSRCFCPDAAPGRHCEGDRTSVVPEPEPSYPEPTPTSTTKQSVSNSTEFDHCASSPCYHGGTCISEYGDFRCICPPKLFGRRCGVGPGGCPGFPCYNGGSCFTDDSGTRCSCPDPNLGVHCEGVTTEVQPEPEPSSSTTSNVNNCASSPCYFGSSCISEYDDFRCFCPPNLFGRRCGVGNGGCPGFPCYNGGTCFTNDSGSRCLCTAGYNGVHCEELTSNFQTEQQPTPLSTFSTPTTTDADHCASSPCYHGATCISEYGDFRCICPPKLFGRRCGVGVGGCPGFPCYNGGSCYTDDSGSRCLCPDAAPGLHCEGAFSLTTTPEISTTSTTRTIPTTPPSGKMKCWYTGSQRKQKGRWNRWCTSNCNLGYCPSDYCTCKDRPVPLRCFAVGQYKNNSGMNDWCNNNCTPSYCPRQFCRCRKGNKG